MDTSLDSADGSQEDSVKPSNLVVGTTQTIIDPIRLENTFRIVKSNHKAHN